MNQNFEDNLTDDELLDVVVRYCVPALKIAVIYLVWSTSAALCGFGIPSLLIGFVVALMACFGSWRVHLQPTTIAVFVAALAYATWARS